MRILLVEKEDDIKITIFIPKDMKALGLPWGIRQKEKKEKKEPFDPANIDTIGVLLAQRSIGLPVTNS